MQKISDDHYVACHHPLASVANSAGVSV
jgi:hypothetical protein